MAFAGRTVGVVNDLSIDEQFYLYDVTRCVRCGANARARACVALD